MPHELDRRLGGALDRRLIDLIDGGAAVGLAHHAGMHHAVDLHVVDEGGLAENLVRQVEALAALADLLHVGDGFTRPAAGRLDRQVHRAGERPVILAGRCAFAQDAAVADRKLAASQPMILAAWSRNNARTSAQACRMATPPN